MIFGISGAYYRSQTIGNGKVIWTESHLFRHDICFLSISSFCGSASQSFDCHSLREGERPLAIAFIYRDRLIWVCRFRQRRLRCTQGNSSYKTSYEYETLAEFCSVIVYLLSSLSFAPNFFVPVLSWALEVARHWILLEHKDELGIIFCWFRCPFASVRKFYVNLFSHSGI